MLLMFQVCFFAGVGLTIVSLILGNILDISGFDGIDLDIDLDFDGLLLPISPLVIMIFVTVYGGSGMILMKTMEASSAVILIISAFIGISVSLLLHKLVFIPLKKAQNTSSPEEEELIGILAMINENIGEEGFGEITYVINGNSFNAPAKSTDGKAIAKGTEVTICWKKDYVFYVMPINNI